jgi:hypothetical protein
LKYPRLIPRTPVETVVIRSMLAVRRKSSNSAYRPTQILELLAGGGVCAAPEATPAVTGV